MAISVLFAITAAGKEQLNNFAISTSIQDPAARAVTSLTLGEGVGNKPAFYRLDHKPSASDKFDI